MTLAEHIILDDSECVKKIDDIYVSLEEMYDQYILKIKDILTK